MLGRELGRLRRSCPAERGNGPVDKLDVSPQPIALLFEGVNPIGDHLGIAGSNGLYLGMVFPQQTSGDRERMRSFEGILMGHLQILLALRTRHRWRVEAFFSP